MGWLEEFRAETAPVIAEPFFRCLAEAIAVVESAHGEQIIAGPEGFNEIGYKALANHPHAVRETLEAGPRGELKRAQASFRLFRNRREQAQALLWLLRSSQFYESARLLFILCFYAAYAPGRRAGAVALLRVFNEIAAGGAHRGVRPFTLLTPEIDAGARALNHAAARRAVRLFGELTAARRADD
ncbi:MAG: hypothetical protein BWZ08_00349 [candidate division BRC1 bacterium ADurb.BinA292]|nr:MAG: hypothetical protein BWZ08_00349 [candidate division BRC1 bacterium ADurb.BinA292]